MQSQVLQLKDKKPDVVIFVSYTSDAILYVKTMQALDYRPPVLIGDTITAIATITAIDAAKRRVALKTQCLNGDKVVIDGEAVVLVPRRPA